MYYIWNLAIIAQALQCFLAFVFQANFCEFLKEVFAIFQQKFAGVIWDTHFSEYFSVSKKLYRDTPVKCVRYYVLGKD